MTEPFDTSAYETAASEADALSSDYQAAAESAYAADDMASYQVLDTQADAWSGYSTSMDAVASDPTDSGAWGDAYRDATTAANEAWSNAVDATIAGDDVAAYEWTQASIQSQSVADQTWDSWGDATSPYEAPAMDASAYEAPVVDTTAYETPVVDPTTYEVPSVDPGYDAGSEY